MIKTWCSSARNHRLDVDLLIERLGNPILRYYVQRDVISDLKAQMSRLNSIIYQIGTNLISQHLCRSHRESLIHIRAGCLNTDGVFLRLSAQETQTKKGSFKNSPSLLTGHFLQVSGRIYCFMC